MHLPGPGDGLGGLKGGIGGPRLGGRHCAATIAGIGGGGTATGRQYAGEESGRLAVGRQSTGEESGILAIGRQSTGGESGRDAGWEPNNEGVLSTSIFEGWGDRSYQWAPFKALGDDDDSGHSGLLPSTAPCISRTERPVE